MAPVTLGVFTPSKSRISLTRATPSSSAQNEIASLKAQLEKLARELKNDKEELFDNATGKEDVKKAVKMAMAKPEMQFCERMGVRALNLPCGKREECFQKPKCKRVPAGMVTPNNL